ncbi:MAG TPA: MMPL family transporter, partial [Pirellulales bacterium]
MLERLLLALDRRPRTCLAVLLLLLVSTAIYLPRIKIDDSPERWLPASTREAWRQLDEHFNFGDTVAVGLEYLRPIRNDDLPPLRAFREQLAKIEGIRQVYDASFIAENIEGVPLSQLVDPANAARYNLYEGALWSPRREGQTDQTLMIACELFYPRDPVELYRIRRNVIDTLYHLIDEAQRDPAFHDVRFHVAGGILLMDELEQRSRLAARVFLPLSSLVGVAILLLGFRSLRALLLTLLGGGVAMVLVVGFVAFSGGGLGALTISAPTLISIIAIATTVHFANYTADTGNDCSTPAAREHMVRWVAVPCLGVAILTSFGFLMLVFNELSPVRALGYELFAGSILAFLCVFILSQWLPIRRAYAGKILLPERFGWWSDLLSRKPKRITAGLLCIMVVFAVLAWPWSPTSPIGLKVVVDPFSFFGPDNHLVKDQQHFLNSGFGLYQLDVILIPKEQGPATSDGQPASEQNAVNQRAAEQYADLLESKTDWGVLHVISTQSFRKRQSQFYDDLAKLQKNEGLLAAGMKLVQLAKASQYLATFQKTFENWNRDKLNQGAVRLTFLAHDRAVGGFEKLVALAKTSIPPQFTGYVSGTIASVVQLADGLVSGVAWGVGLSVVIMWLVCVVLFRSWRLGTIALFPNAFPIIVVYGYMGLVGTPLSSGSAMVATVSLGMNQTIFIIMRYRKKTREQGLDTNTAIRDTLVHIGRPVVLTSMVFTIGFLIFLLSDFLPLHNFGLLTSIAMVAGLLCDMM